VDRTIRETLAKLPKACAARRLGFTFTAKIVKLLEQRSEWAEASAPWINGFAELLAYGSLVLEGIRCA